MNRDQHGPVTGDLVPNIFGPERQDLLKKVVYELGNAFGELEATASEPMPFFAVVDTITAISNAHQLTLKESAALAFDLGVFTRMSAHADIEGDVAEFIPFDIFRQVVATMIDHLKNTIAKKGNESSTTNEDTFDAIIEGCTKHNLSVREVIAFAHDFGMYDNNS